MAYLDKHSTLDLVMVSVQIPVEGGNFLLKYFKPLDVNSGLKCKCDLIVKNSNQISNKGKTNPISANLDCQRASSLGECSSNRVLPVIVFKISIGMPSRVFHKLAEMATLASQTLLCKKKTKKKKSSNNFLLGRSKILIWSCFIGSN